MAQDGVQSDDGTFIRASIDEIINRKRDRAETNFGPDVDLSQGSPLKQLIDVNAAEHEHIWKLMEEVYYSGYYEDAYGTQLDKVLSIASINRRRRRGATGVVEFTSTVAPTEDIVIRQGVRLATESDDDRPPIPFKTTVVARMTAGSTIATTEDGSTGIPIRACEPWETDLDPEWLGEETNVPARTIETFETPVRGVDSVSNPYPTGESSREEGYSFIEGRDRETDDEFRDRFERKFGTEAYATLDALRSNVQNLRGIRAADIEENVTMQDNTDDGGLPPKSFRLETLGDHPRQDIADVILERRPVGIESYGSVSATTVDSAGVEHEEYWDEAAERHVYVEVEVAHTEAYPSDGNLAVEREILRYIGGETANGDEFDGTNMGKDVIYDLVHAAAMSVNGVWRANVEMGTDNDNLNPDDVIIPEGETAMTDHTDVLVFSNEEQIQ